MEINSHGGAMSPITKDDFKKDRIITMKYLNRRIGDFLKELHLTEGKGTGIPKIKRAMKNNGSDEPIFETDEARTYFVTILKVRKGETLLEIIPPNNRRIPPNILSQDEEILEYVKKYGSITSKKVEEILVVKDSRAKEILRNLASKNLLIKQGTTRAVSYILGEIKNDK